jgi:hypothetical protein
LPLDIAGRNLFGFARNYLAAYCYYSGRRIAVRRVFAKIGYAECLDDGAVNGAATERIANRQLVGMPSVSADFRIILIKSTLRRKMTPGTTSARRAKIPLASGIRPYPRKEGSKSWKANGWCLRRKPIHKPM